MEDFGMRYLLKIKNLTRLNLESETTEAILLFSPWFLENLQHETRPRRFDGCQKRQTRSGLSNPNGRSARDGA
jgi:hypothetical protein